MPNEANSTAARAGTRSWFAPPILATEEQTHRAQTFWKIALLVLCVWTIALIAFVLQQPNSLSFRGATAALMWGLGLAALACNRQGRTTLASWGFLLGLIALTTHRAWLLGGLHAPLTALLVIFVMMGCLLLGPRGGLAIAILCAAAASGLALEESLGHLPSAHFAWPTPHRLLFVGLCLGLALVLGNMISRTVREGMQRNLDELARRQKAEGRFALAIDAARFGVWEQDPTTGVYLGDERTFTIFQIPRTPNGVVPLDVWQKTVDPDDLPRVMEALAAARKGAQHVRAAYRFTLADGTPRQAEVYASAVLDHEGQPTKVVGMVADVTDRFEAQRERERLLVDLGERVKELRLLHFTSRLVQSGRAFDQDFLEALIKEIPPAWKYPECCEARIVYRDLEVKTPGWRESPWKLSSDLVTSEGRGLIEVAYLRECPRADEGPFLKEERQLLNSLTEMLATHAAHSASEEQRRRLEDQLRQSQKMPFPRCAGSAANHSPVHRARGSVDPAIAHVQPPAGHPIAEPRSQRKHRWIDAHAPAADRRDHSHRSEIAPRAAHRVCRCRHARSGADESLGECTRCDARRRHAADRDEPENRG